MLPNRASGSIMAADTRVHEFFKSPYFKKGIYPIPGALQALRKLSEFCSLSIVTYVYYLPLACVTYAYVSTAVNIGSS